MLQAVTEKNKTETGIFPPDGRKWAICSVAEASRFKLTNGSKWN